MGSPLSPVVANIFMEDFENTALLTADLSPKVWFRYVDDTFVVWQHGRNKLEDFLTHLNTLHERIKFTMELESSGTIPFLDVLVEKSTDCLSTDVYRKPTHTDLYLNFRSNHHPKTKYGVVKCLSTRALRICGDSTKINSESHKLYNIFLSLGYPHRKISNLLNNRDNTKRIETAEDVAKEDKKPLVLPYIPKLSEKILTSCKHLEDVRITFSSKNTLRSSLSRVKSSIPLTERSGVIYSIPCSCGRTYIGETGRSLQTRITEHKRAVRIGDPKNAISVHANSTGHSIEWNNGEILAYESNLPRRKIREAIIIRQTRNSLNTDPGVAIHPTWKPFFQDHSHQRDDTCLTCSLEDV